MMNYRENMKNNEVLFPAELEAQRQIDKNLQKQQQQRNKAARQQCRRGELYYADLNPVRGSEQGGVRPVVIIQNNTGNKHSPTIIVAPITAKNDKPKLPTHVAVNVPNGDTVGRNCTALLEQLRTIDKSRLHSKVGEVTEQEMVAIDNAIRVSLALD